MHNIFVVMGTRHDGSLPYTEAHQPFDHNCCACSCASPTCRFSASLYFARLPCSDVHARQPPVTAAAWITPQHKQQQRLSSAQFSRRERLLAPLTASSSSSSSSTGTCAQAFPSAQHTSSLMSAGLETRQELWSRICRQQAPLGHYAASTHCLKMLRLGGHVIIGF